VTGTATTNTILLCDGCFQAATGLPTDCDDGCTQELSHTGLCRRASPDHCQWMWRIARSSSLPA
jgi:hypothetical protein